jgi:drug/metabolite transporter (DMT)-like permease
MSRATTAMLFATATVIWGSTWLAIKYQLGVVAPEVSVAWRFLAAGILLGAWCLAGKRPLRFGPRAHAFLALQGALLFGFNYIGVYWAEQHATSGLVAVLFSTIVFMNPVGARLAFGSPLSPRALGAAALGVAGVGLLFLPELRSLGGSADTMKAIGYGLGSTAIASAGNLAAARNQRAGIPVLQGTAWSMLYGGAVAAAVAFALGLPFRVDSDPAWLASLAYLCVFGSVLAFSAYLTLLKAVGPGKAAYVGVGTPVVALLLSTAFEGYQWSGAAALGVALAVAANLIALWPRSPRPLPGVS